MALNGNGPAAAGGAQSAQKAYSLGYSDTEHQRLMVQARFLRPWTERFLRAGGLRPGMSVLDLGSGIGDVSLLAAEIVGPQGRVLGIERDKVSTDKARLRAATEGLTANVSFQAADLSEFRPDGLVDAVIGRYVLFHVADPVAILRRYAQSLRPGGVVIFHEVDLRNPHPSAPARPEWDEPFQLLAAALMAAGKTPDFGRVLAPTFLAAGLPLPVVEAITPIATGPESPVFDWLARTLHNLRPVFDRTGDRLPAGLDFGNLTEHWQRAAAEGVQMQGPVQYGAWTRVP